MSLYPNGLKEALMNPKKGYYNVMYETPKPLPPKRTCSMTTMLDKGEKVKKKSKTNLSLFG